MTMTDSAEEALHSSAMDAADAGVRLEEALDRVRAAYAQAAIERGEEDETGAPGEDDEPEQIDAGVAGADDCQERND